MLKKLILGLLLASTSDNLFAQSDSIQAKKPPRWEVAVDLLSLTNKATLPPSLFSRMYFGKNSAIRLRLGSGMLNRKDLREHGSLGYGKVIYDNGIPVGVLYPGSNVPAPVFQNYAEPFKERSLYTSLGYQKGGRADKLLYYAYFDAFLNIQKNTFLGTQNRQSPGINDYYLITTKIINLIYGAATGGGLGYQIHKRASVSLETGLEFRINSFKHDVSVREIPFDDPSTGNYIVGLTYTLWMDKDINLLRFIPIRAINLSFHF